LIKLFTWLRKKDDLLASTLWVYVKQLAKDWVRVAEVELKPAQSWGLTCLREADRPTFRFEKQEPRGFLEPSSFNLLFKVVMYTDLSGKGE